MAFRKKAEQKKPPEIHPVYDTPASTTPEPPRPNRVTGVGTHGSEAGVPFFVDSAGRKIVAEGHRCAGEVMR